MKLREQKGSMAVYVTVVLVGMIFILMAMFFISNSVRKTQLRTNLKVKEAYEADNAKADQIYASLTREEEEEGGEDPDNIYGYVMDGLILHYDGINNTGDGHSDNTTIWKDLSGNGNDAILNNIRFNDDNSLSAIDNTSYAVRKVNIPGSNTIEIVAQYDSTDIGYLYALEQDDNRYFYLWNYSNSGNTMSYRYVNNGTWDVHDNITDETSITNKKLFITISFNASTKNAIIYVNGQYHKTVSIPKYENVNNTRLRLFNEVTGEKPLIGGRIYTVRVYDRILTTDEIQENYEIDKNRYQ